MFRLTMILLTAVLAMSAMADSHIQTTSYGQSGEETGRSDFWAKNGDLLVEQTGFSHEATASSSAAAGDVKSRAIQDKKVQETVVFHLQAQELLALEGSSAQCQWISKDTKLPTGLNPGAGQMADFQKQMAEGMAELNKVLAEAKKDMDPESRKALDQYTKGLGSGVAGMVGDGDSLTLRKTDRRKTINEFSVVAWEAVNRNGEVRFVLWLTDVNKVAGGAEMKRTWIGMIDFFETVLEGMGVGSLMDSNELKFLKSKELDGLFLVRQEDRADGSYTDVTLASSGAVTKNFYPDCEKVDMLGRLGGP